AQEALRANRDKLEAYENLCDSLGEQPAIVALAWLLHQDGVTAPIIGPRTIEQFDEMQRAVKLSLAPETLERLDTIFPGYKPAPEHYAW
ncbi:MAG TPA: aldo/keto reductase, partial [Streptosporangiaceae bacterium]